MGLLDLLLGDVNSVTARKSAQTVSPSSPPSPTGAKNGDEVDEGDGDRAQVTTNTKTTDDQERLRRTAFPRCPGCTSYALYRKNNVGLYQCDTCGLEEISEAVARRMQ
jgi:hypothetical protein